jgi:glc operon protein GlcG
MSETTRPNEFTKPCHNLTLAGAKHVRDHALLHASQLGIPVSVVIVDRTGVILLLETADDTPPESSEAAIRKAKGASRYGVATHLTAEYLKTIPAPLVHQALSLPDVCAFQGGAPIRIDGEVVGGVGIAGGTGEQDIIIALAAAASLR